MYLLWGLGNPDFSRRAAARPYGLDRPPPPAAALSTATEAEQARVAENLFLPSGLAQDACNWYSSFTVLSPSYFVSSRRAVQHLNRCPNADNQRCFIRADILIDPRRSPDERATLTLNVLPAVRQPEPRTEGA
jgi:hypothetical protein